MFLLAIAAAARAATADPAEATASAAKGDQSEQKLVCRDIRVTGTRFGSRVCKPAAAWRSIQEKSEAAVRETQSRPMINCNQPATGEPC